MSDYIKPDKVISPRRMWSLIQVLEQGSEESHAIAIGKWEQNPVLGIRWNGSKESPIGTPQSRGLPTWFIIPKALEEAVIGILKTDDQIFAKKLLNQNQSTK